MNNELLLNTLGMLLSKKYGCSITLERTEDEKDNSYVCCRDGLPNRIAVH